MNKEKFEVNTPLGVLEVEKKGIVGEYPGVWISLKGKGHLVTVEYEELKQAMQAVIYENHERDEPTNITIFK